MAKTYDIAHITYNTGHVVTDKDRIPKGIDTTTIIPPMDKIVAHKGPYPVQIEPFLPFMKNISIYTSFDKDINALAFSIFQGDIPITTSILFLDSTTDIKKVLSTTFSYPSNLPDLSNYSKNVILVSVIHPNNPNNIDLTMMEDIAGFEYEYAKTYLI